MVYQKEILWGVEVARVAILKRFISGQLGLRAGEQGNFCQRDFRQLGLTEWTTKNVTLQDRKY